MKNPKLVASMLVGLMLPAVAAHADSQPSRHRLYRDCMAKQKEADSGKNHDEMKAFCEDYAKTQRSADKTEEKAEEKAEPKT